MPRSERIASTIDDTETEEFFDGPSPRHFELDHAYQIFVGPACDWMGRRTPYNERALPLLLADEELFSSGVIYLKDHNCPTFKIKRRKILPELWWYLEPNYRKSSAKGAGLKIREILVHVDDPIDCEPFGLHDLPTAAAYQPVELSHNENYTHITCAGMSVILAGFQCDIFRILHEASKRDDPWIYGPNVPADIGANTKSLGDLFARKKEFWNNSVETDRGFYRLRDARSFAITE